MSNYGGIPLAITMKSLGDIVLINRKRFAWTFKEKWSGWNIRIGIMMLHSTQCCTQFLFVKSL